jgi:beta-ketodecanoyl-[acyl-carrier-protein] synthase
MTAVVISGSGLFTPESTISNQELVASFNQYVANFNSEHSQQIATGELQALETSSEEFIEKVSGIKSRHVLKKDGILDPEIMSPDFQPLADEEHSVMCKMAIQAANQAFLESGIQAAEIDMVIAAASNMERAYPAMSIEIQHALGCGGYGFDMNVACSSATFAIKTGVDAIKSGSVDKVLIVNPEICSGHLNFRNRDCHFIFGDVCTAIVLEKLEDISATNKDEIFTIKDAKLVTQYSNNIRNNFGFLNRTAEDPQQLLFKQNGRKVFKEVVPIVAELITNLLSDNQLTAANVKSFWLHQANLNMNMLIAKKVLGYSPDSTQAPIVLDEYANTSSAGSVIAFHKYKSQLSTGDSGVLCSFGAGYSAGAVLLEKI